jgi:tungstate transport system permease protein
MQGVNRPVTTLLIEALQRIVALDREVLDVTTRTLAISGTATILSCLVFVPVATLIHHTDFRGKNLVVGAVQTLYSMPTVLVGLLVYLLLSRSGPLGGLGLLFTPQAVAIGQAPLIAPVVMGLSITTLQGVGTGVRDTALGLGASHPRAALAVVLQARHAWATVVLMAFGRAVSEVGVAMMVGGNIRGYTRTLTTAISLGVGRGDNAEAVALGIMLLVVALAITILATVAGRLSRGA